MARRIPELAAIEFDSVENIKKYADELRDHFRDLTNEIDTALSDLQAILEEQEVAGNKFDARMKARKAVRPLRRVANRTYTARIDVVRFWATFTRVYADVINPQKKRKTKQITWN